MNPVIALLALTTAVNSLLEGLTVDAALAIVLIHRCTDSIAYATFPRGNDFENGVVISPLLLIRATLLIVLGSVLTSAERSSLSRRRLLLIYFFSRECKVCIITRDSREKEVL